MYNVVLVSGIQPKWFSYPCIYVCVYIYIYTHIYIYIPFIFFPIMVYFLLLNTVPSAMQ